MDQVIQMLPEPLKKFSTHYDFVGQKRAERIYQVILVISGIIGFSAGFITQRLSYTVITILGGFLLSCLVVLPPWSYFRQNPIKWQVVQKEKEESPSTSTGQGKNNKKKAK
ncbi:hypothetical protein QR680_012943 [Steinernema hermaphroditum]|uniref:Signal peptidase complex subunit 1 n=1 Tax=Steinernema hermaphroditum TaxID=289476 RepID=A0AA39M1G9_9BILA|nr:hypothetical protein QR680_012943 [Steinernema hermaphroditum]